MLGSTRSDILTYFSFTASFPLERNDMINEKIRLCFIFFALVNILCLLIHIRIEWNLREKNVAQKKNAVTSAAWKIQTSAKNNLTSYKK